MFIFTKGAVEKSQMSKEISKPAARKDLESRIKMEERNSSDPWWRTRMRDSGEARKNLRMFQRSYENTAPEKLDPATESKMWKRAKQLKDEFMVGMLSKDELHPVKGFLVDGKMQYVVDEEKMRTIHSTEREQSWLTKNQSKIREFKNLMRHLDPENPNAGDIERFRPRGRIK